MTYYHASDRNFEKPKHRFARVGDRDFDIKDYNRVLGLWSANRTNGLNAYGSLLYTFKLHPDSVILDVPSGEISNGQPEGYWYGLREGLLMGGIDALRSEHFQVVINYERVIEWTLVDQIPKNFYDNLWGD